MFSSVDFERKNFKRAIFLQGYVKNQHLSWIGSSLSSIYAWLEWGWGGGRGSVGFHYGPHARGPVPRCALGLMASARCGSMSVVPTVDSYGPPHLNPIKHTWAVSFSSWLRKVFTTTFVMKSLNSYHDDLDVDESLMGNQSSTSKSFRIFQVFSRRRSQVFTLSVDSGIVLDCIDLNRLKNTLSNRWVR